MVVGPVTRHQGGDGASGQLGLFGGPSPTPAPSGPGRPTSTVESNDLDLIHTVAHNAIRCGYLLVGTTERVYSRAEGERADVVRVPRYEEDAVHQLLRRRWLTLGATQRVSCGAATLLGTTVLVPKATRDRVARWSHYQRPTSWAGGPPPPRAAHTGPTCSACGDTGLISNARRMRWSPEKGAYREEPSSSPCTWCQRPTHKKRR